ncbi:uncharacterized protein ISCGN_011479 [Ixodes scapularis]
MVSTSDAWDSLDFLALDESMSYVHPKEVSMWEDNMKSWPPIEKPDIVFYLVHSKACDLQEVRAYKSLESYLYLTSGLVGTVLHHRISDQLGYFKAEVGRSQSFNAAPHKAWACVHTTGRVVTGGCSCMAGQAKVCSHVGAILWKMEHAFANKMTGTACTDEAAAWNRGTKKNVTPTSLDNISFGKNEQNTEILGTVDVLQFHTHEEYLHHIEDGPLAGLMKIPGTLFHETLMAPPRDPPAAQDPSAVQCDAIPLAHSSHEDATTLPNSCPACWEAYNELVAISAPSMDLLCKKTADQGSCTLWHESRRMRLTSSMVKRIPILASTDPSKAVKDILHPSFRGNQATEHGRRSEPKARRKFMLDHHCTVRQTGLVVCPELPWLAASPDGIIDGIDALLEIKCPNVLNCEDLLNSGKYDIKKNGNGIFELQPKGKNKFYYQVQFAMHCTGKTVCHLYVWSEGHDEVVVVPYNKDFMKCHLQRVKNFYFKSLLPAFVEDVNSGKITLSNEYKQLARM